MDPNACLTRIVNALDEGDYEECQSACADLLDWIAKDGFLPNDREAFAALLQVLQEIAEAAAEDNADDDDETEEPTN